MEQPNYYAIIPANVRYDNSLTPNAKLLYGEITALCNEKGFCWATNEYFANLYGVNKVSVSKWISSLVNNGYIYSNIQYKEGSKEILNRCLTIVSGPIKEKFNPPIKEKFKENNTILNNTSNNKEIYKERFKQFWSAYPKRVDKANAEKSFNKIKCDDALIKIILSAIENQKNSDQWQKDNGKYIPYPSTWLNQHRWEDETTVLNKPQCESQFAEIDYSAIKFEEE